ncbi:MAG: helix-turn-helix domain-containing protein [Gemmatimonadales bacterium]|nr:helix-turn-helix domain-containing protein [Gemmatimonadales bacterium]
MTERRGSEAQGEWPGVTDLDPALGHRSRLGICVLLAGAERMTFRLLQDRLDESDGGLGAHLKRLEEERYVTAAKKFVDRKPVTWYALSARGRTALRRHLEALERLLKATNNLT